MPEIKVPSEAAIFAVDDDPMFQEILEFAYGLSEIENELVFVSSGYDCVEKLREIKETGGTLPSIILMDINMPGMNGFETVEKIRSDENFRTIPIITMLSSSDEILDIEKAKKVGADDYCEKPFDITTLKFSRD